MPVENSSSQSEEAVAIFARMNASVGSFIITLLTLLQVKSGNTDQSPFETHSVVMKLFIVTLLIYTLVAVAAITIRAPLVPVLHKINIAAGFLACGLLLLILAPPFGYFLLGIWVLLLLPVLLYYVFTLAERFLRKVKENFQKWWCGTSTQQQDGFSPTSENNNEMNLRQIVQQA